MKVKNDPRSEFSNLSNWKEEAWKKSGLQRDSNPWPPRYRCDFTPHGKIWTQQIDLAPNVWLHSSVGRASHRYRGGHGFESRWSPDFFQASSFQLLKLENSLRGSFFTFIIIIISYLVQRYGVFDHAPQTVDDGRESDSARCITIAVHLGPSSREIKHCTALQGKVIKSLEPLVHQSLMRERGMWIL